MKDLVKIEERLNKSHESYNTVCFIESKKLLSLPWANSEQGVHIFTPYKSWFYKNFLMLAEMSYSPEMLYFVNGRHRTMWMANVLKLEKVPVLMDSKSFAKAVVDDFVSASDIGFEGMLIPGMMPYQDILFTDVQ
jgi:hypothetical protein